MSQYKPLSPEPVLKRLILSLTAGLFLGGPSFASDPAGAREIAEAYLDAYRQQDLDAMREFYAEGARFLDPTSFGIPAITAPIDWQGADAIIAGIASWGIDHMRYHLDRSYESSNAVVFDGSADVTYATPSGERTFNYPIITIITIRGGQVVEHRDYTDYDGAREIGLPMGNQEPAQ